MTTHKAMEVAKQESLLRDHLITESIELRNIRYLTTQ